MNAAYRNRVRVSLYYTRLFKRELEAKNLKSTEFAERCADECDDYVALLDVNVPLQSKQGLSDLAGVVRYLQISAAPPLLLAAYRSLDGHDFEKLLRALLATHIRWVVITNQNPLDLESRIYEAARTIRSLKDAGAKSDKILAEAKRKLGELSVTDSSLEQAADLTLQRSEAVWIVSQIANSLQSKTKEVGMEKANLEHVFPQNPSAKDWPNADALEGLTWHIGNLTILGERLNRSAQNKGFAEKCANYYSKSEVEMTRELLTETTWDEATIRKRGARLVEKLSKLWPALK